VYTTHPQAFELHRPETIDEAIRLLGSNGDTKAIAGGHSLLPAMKLRLSTPSTIVDLGRIPGLDGITQEGDSLIIGALATHAAVVASDTIRSACPILAEAAALIGDRQVRNRGTIGGSIAHADPGADYPTVVSALEATIEIRGSGGERQIGAADFFTGVFTTALEPGELITAVRVPVTAAGIGTAYLKHKHPASGYAVVGVAAIVGVDGGTCSGARLVVGGATGTPALIPVDRMIGIAPVKEAIEQATADISSALGDAIGDTYASAEYRRHLAGVLARRALTTAAERAG
jgi:carbon-monoxide dehydrogenase medium subunit